MQLAVAASAYTTCLKYREALHTTQDTLPKLPIVQRRSTSSDISDMLFAKDVNNVGL